MWGKLRAAGKYSKEFATELVNPAFEQEGGGHHQEVKEDLVGVDASLLIHQPEDSELVSTLREALTKSNVHARHLHEESSFCRPRIVELEKQEAELLHAMNEWKNYGEGIAGRIEELEATLKREQDIHTDEMSAVHQQYKTIIQELNATVATAQATASEKSVVVAGVQETVEVSSNTANLQKRIDGLQADNAQLKQELSASSAGVEQHTAELQKRIDGLQADNAQLKQELSASSAGVEQHTAELQKRIDGLQADNAQLAKGKSELETRIEDLTAENKRLDLEVDEIEFSKERLVKDLAAARDGVQSGSDLVKEELDRLRGVVRGVEELVMDAVKNKGLDCSGGTSTGVMGLVEAVMLRWAESSASLVEKDGLLGQWESVYSQARTVNEDLQRRWQETEGEYNRVQQLLAHEQQKANGMAGSLAELDTLRNLKQEAEVRNRDASVKEKKILDENIELKEHVDHHRAELEHCRDIIHQQEEEVSRFKTTAGRLQGVLDQFHESKQRDVEERTSYLSHEIDGFKAQVKRLTAEKEEVEGSKETALRECRRELASKHCIVTSLQSKLTELRKVLEETMGKLNDENSIDKRIVSHLMVNYIHSNAMGRKDGPDILRVMSTLLGWDASMNEKTGLTVGPLNPPTSRPRALFGGVVRTLWGKPEAQAEGGDAATEPKSLAEMWVNFLIHESEAKEGGEHMEGADGGAAAAAFPGFPNPR